jgi:hypothetical protein
MGSGDRLNSIREILSNMIETETGCWEWQLSVKGRGYGQITFMGKRYYVHRLMYELYRGPPGKSSVLHHCDNKICGNPEHLFLGNHSINAQDMHDKRRQKGIPWLGPR